jgi:hypothetical protein
MKHHTEQTPDLWIKVAQSPWMQGPLLGSSVMAMVTPLLNWTNNSLSNTINPAFRSIKNVNI